MAGLGKRIFITGGASGLGRAIATRFARAGWRVAIGDVNDQRGAEARATLGTDALYLHCDVTKEADFAAAVTQLQAAWGGIDVLVNNAGVAAAGAIDEISLEDWQWIVNINFLGVVRGCRAFVPMLKAQQSGHIVNVASMAGLLDVPFMSSYNATKAAVISLSETLDNELAEHDIRVSVVCPSFFKTNLNESMRSTDAGLRRTMEKLLERGKLSADDVAVHVFEAVSVDHRFYVLPHADGRIAWTLKSVAPRRVYTAFMRRRVSKMRDG